MAAEAGAEAEASLCEGGAAAMAMADEDAACPSRAAAQGDDEPARDTAFRAAERRYKRRAAGGGGGGARRQRVKGGAPQPVDLSDVIDFARPREGAALAEPLELSAAARAALPAGGESASLFAVRGCPGLFVIARALSPDQQLLWAHRCLAEYSAAPHNNISNLRGPQRGDLFARAVESGDASALEELRWSSLGYHFDWSARRYRAAARSPLPAELRALARGLAAAAGQPLEPEAAIVNFYAEASTMGAHLDDAELSARHPIVSLSLGASAVFLIGGPSKRDAPLALLLRSGDALVMSGPSRNCYHGVPRVLEGSSPLAGDEAAAAAAVARAVACGAREAAVVARYLAAHRVNVNVRQVEGDAPGERFAERE